jgi:hypothetical protein
MVQNCSIRALAKRYKGTRVQESRTRTFLLFYFCTFVLLSYNVRVRYLLQLEIVALYPATHVAAKID